MNVDDIGSFVFINLGYGILSGIYHHTNSTEPYPESAKRIKDNTPNNHPSDLFDGVYKSVWLIFSDQDDKSDLEIMKQSDGSYKLRWYDKKGTYFKGIGFIRNNELLGSFWAI